ncbi:hypothetical protein V6N12_044779 [Hibiscus sabdariffa]|uniref:PRONE domain-containing protein n=1 Tax=Hibiscus sabdariffa TaxID=183260 RepID=A0ABR2BCT0_9ROSI
MMMERMVKLLLGEDMFGGGKGVFTALAISNALTNLLTTVLGELWRLEPSAISTTEEGNVEERNGVAVAWRQLWNVDRGLVVGDGGDTHLFSVGGLSIRQEGKWWLPCPNGFRMMQQCRDGTNQLLKAAMAISSSVLVEMEIPTAHFEDLPKVLR